MNSIVSNKSNQNDKCMKVIKVEQKDLDKSVSPENSNSNKKNKSMNLKIVKLHNYLDLIIKINNRF